MTYLTYEQAKSKEKTRLQRMSTSFIKKELVKGNLNSEGRRWYNSELSKRKNMKRPSQKEIDDFYSGRTEARNRYALSRSTKPKKPVNPINRMLGI